MHSTYSRTLVWNITGSESFLVAYYIGLNTVPSKFLFTYRLCMWPYLETVLHCCQVKKRLCQIRVGSNPIWTHTRQRLPCEDRHRLNNASISQTRSASASNHQKFGDKHGKDFPQSFQRTNSANALTSDFQPPEFSSERILSIVLRRPVCRILLWQPQEINTEANIEFHQEAMGQFTKSGNKRKPVLTRDKMHNQEIVDKLVNSKHFNPYAFLSENYSVSNGAQFAQPNHACCLTGPGQFE